jgi:uncharacterized membrane protein YphA (DoxX/SURF4 family)
MKTIKNSNKNTSGALKTIYWVATIIIAISFFVTGVGNLMPFEHIAREMSHLGYPQYFLKILGTWKIFGAVAIIFPGMPRIREWAYAGMVFDLTGAAFSRSAAGDSVIMVIVPIAIVSLVAISWALVPKGNEKIIIKE